MTADDPLSPLQLRRLELIRAAIVATLAAVPDVGQVHDRERYAVDEARFRALFLFTPSDGPQQLRGWTVRRASTAEHLVNLARHVCVDTWVIRGYMAFSDEAASERVFDGLIESFRGLVREDPCLGGTCEASPLTERADPTDGVQVLDSGPVRFAGVLCHSAVLQLRTWSYL